MSGGTDFDSSNDPPSVFAGGDVIGTAVRGATLVSCDRTVVVRVLARGLRLALSSVLLGSIDEEGGYIWGIEGVTALRGADARAISFSLSDIQLY